jgi:two-component system, response regulator YesN
VVTWVASYILMFILPIIISGVMYYRVENIVRNEVNRANDFLLNEMQNYMDSLISDIENMAVEIAYNVNIRPLLRLGKMPSIENQYKILEAVKAMKAYNNIRNKSYGKYYIYLKESDTIIDDISSYEPMQYYNLNCEKDYYSYDEWYSMVTGVYKSDYINLSNKKNAEENKNLILYARSIPVETYKQALGSIFIEVNKNRFNNLESKIEELNKGLFFILDKDNKIINFNDKKDMHEIINYDNLLGNSGQVSMKDNRKTEFVFYITSHFKSWKYVYIMPKAVFLEKVQYARMIFIFSIFICLILGVITTYLLIKRNYAPLKKLIVYIGDHLKVKVDNTSSEYNLIEEAIDKTVYESKSMGEQLLSQRHILKSRFIERLIKGKEAIVTINDSLASFDINFKYDGFCIITFCIEEFLEIFEEVSGKDYNEIFKTIQFIIHNMLQELIADNGEVIVAEVDGTVVAILNIQSNENVDENDYSRVMSLVEELKQYINKYFKIRFSASISNIYSDICNIPNAYKESMEALEYKIVMGIERNVLFKDINYYSKEGYYYPLEKEQQLINYIKAGDTDKAQNVVNEVFYKNFQEATISLEITKCLIFNMIGTIIKTSNEINEICDKSVEIDFDVIYRLINYKSINKIKSDFMYIICSICNQVSANERTGGKQLKDTIIKYIEENYQDENLSISSIADYLSMNPSYISKVFKSQSGEGMLDYIGKVRINKAKEIMKEEKINLESLAKAVGYSSVRTFSRVFYKNEGINPGKYKEILS